jgi:signal transduction histidine kinase
VLTLVLVFFLVTIVFYSTEFRTSLNHYFFDLTVRLMPDRSPAAKTVVLGIDDESIQLLEQDPLRVRRDTQKRPYLGTWALVRAAGILGNTNARSIVFLMPEHAFPASGIDMAELVEYIRYDSRMLIGTIGFNQKYPNTSVLPKAFLSIADQVSGYETFRSRSSAVVRKLPLTSFRGTREILNLPALAAKVANPGVHFGGGSFTINAKAPDAFVVIRFSDFIADPQRYMDEFSDKVVVVGYTTPRDAGFQTTELMTVNTPATGFNINNRNGISQTLLISNAIENLLDGRGIKEAHGAWVVLQTIVVAALCGIAWEWGSVFAATVTCAVWVTLLGVLALVYQWFNVTVPIADTFLASVLMSVFAAVRRLRIDLIALAAIAARKQATEEIVAVQSRFLTGFAQWLQNATNMVMSKTRAGRQEFERTGSDAERMLFDRAFLAGEDFSEYLESVRQIPEIESLRGSRVALADIDLERIIPPIIRRFEAKLRAKGAEIRVTRADQAKMARANAQLLDAVLYNLISNAIKYGPQGGVVDIEISASAGRTVVRVCDRGPGVADEFKDRIFEKFYRVRDDRMYQSKGSGLGLYLVRYFVEAMNGAVTVLDRDGGGSIFEVRL